MAQPNELVRVRITRGVRAQTTEGFQILSPGDVVDVEKRLANNLYASNRAERAPDGAALQRDPNYLPERKRSQLVTDVARAKAELARAEALAAALTVPAAAAKGEGSAKAAKGA